MIEDIMDMKCMLIESIKEHMEHDMDAIDTKEAGEIIDMIKDLAMTEYYCTVVEAMHSDDPNLRKRFKMELSEVN